MYYHCIVETKDKSAKDKGTTLYSLHNESLDDIVSLIVRPYSDGKQIFIDGHHLERAEIKSLKVKQTAKTLAVLVDEAYARIAGKGFFVPFSEVGMLSNADVAKDITIDVMKSVGPILPTSTPSNKVVETQNRVFLSHGRSKDWYQVQAHIEKDLKHLGLQTLELAQEPSLGSTIIEKLEANAKRCDSAVIVMSGDDKDSADNLRARENVMHEIGYFQASYGRSKVILLHEDSVSVPTNLAGIVYVPYPKDSVDAAFAVMARELKAMYGR